MAPNPKPIIVLVLGAFHKATAFPAFERLLHEAGFEEVQIVALASCSDDSATLDPALAHADTARAIRARLLPRLDEGREAVVVAHSGGALAAVAAIEGQTVAERSERGLKGGITAYIAVSAIAYPARGKGLMGDDTPFEPQEYHDVKDGLTTLLPSAIPIWWSDLPRPEAQRAYEGLYKYMTWKSFAAFPDYVERDIRAHRAYVICEDDMAIPAAWQEGLVKAGEFHEVFRVRSGHAAFLKVPERIVEIVGEVAAKTSSST